MLAALVGCNSSAPEEAARTPPQPATAVISDVQGGFLQSTFRGDTEALLLFSPDDPAGEIAITNDGSRAGYFAMTQEVVASEPASGPESAPKLVDLVLTEAGGNGRPEPLYRGPVGGFTPITVGPVDPGEKRRFRFRFSGGRRPLLSLVYRWPTTGAPDGTGERAEPGPPVQLRLHVPRSQRVLDTRTFFVRARCEEPCSFTGEAQLRAGGREPVDLVGRPYRGTRTPRAVVLAFRLPSPALPAVRRAIEGRARAVARVRIRATARGRLAATRSTSIRLTGVPEGG